MKCSHALNAGICHSQRGAVYCSYNVRYPFTISEFPKHKAAGCPNGTAQRMEDGSKQVFGSQICSRFKGIGGLTFSNVDPLTSTVNHNTQGAFEACMRTANVGSDLAHLPNVRSSAVHLEPARRPQHRISLQEAVICDVRAMPYSIRLFPTHQWARIVNPCNTCIHVRSEIAIA